MSSALPSKPDDSPVGSATLRTWDVISLLIGIVVGVGILKVPSQVFSLAGSPERAFFIWGLGACLAFCGALCYSELAAAWPKWGGEYVYLSEAFGKRCGFVFAWMNLFAVLPGNIGAAAFIFADYAGHLHPILARSQPFVAMAAIAGLMTLQLLGLVAGRRLQNILTVLKILALSGVLLAGLLLPAAPVSLQEPTATPPWNELGLALVFVLFAYGGWNDVAMVTPEVRDCRRNMPRALLLGLALVALLYLALNFAFWRVLGTEGVKTVSAPAAALIDRTLGGSFAAGMSLIVMISALGAMNGMIFTGSRLLSAVGSDFLIFRKWNRWNRRQVPVWSVLTIGLISMTLILLVGVRAGQQIIETAVQSVGFHPPDWQKYGGGFEVLVAASAPVFWSFFLLSAIALIVLRFTQPQRERPFRLPFYPLPALLFIATACFMLWSSLSYARNITLLVLPTLLIGLLVPLRSPPASDPENEVGTPKPRV